jgi:hypothetical protein
MAGRVPMTGNPIQRQGYRLRQVRLSRPVVSRQTRLWCFSRFTGRACQPIDPFARGPPPPIPPFMWTNAFVSTVAVVGRDWWSWVCLGSGHQEVVTDTRVIATAPLAVPWLPRSSPVAEMPSDRLLASSTGVSAAKRVAGEYDVASSSGSAPSRLAGPHMSPGLGEMWCSRHASSTTPLRRAKGPVSANWP